MTGSKVRGQALVVLLGAALKHFGRITPENQQQVARWVMRKAREIDAGNEPGPVDVKEKQAGS